MSSSKATVTTKPSTTSTTKVLSTITSFARNPLTTTFTPNAPGCGTGLSWDARNVAVADTELSCMPSGFSTAEYSFFSPGYICPLGYASACHDNAGVSSVTTVTCCPSRSGIQMTCNDRMAISGAWSNYHCTWAVPVVQQGGTLIEMTSSDGGSTVTKKELFPVGGGVNAFGVRMVYQSGDLPSSLSSLASQTSSSTGTPGGNEQNQGGGGSLSAGAAAGIAIGVIALIGLAAAAAWMVWRRKRKAAAAAAAANAGGAAGGYGAGGYSDVPPAEGSQYGASAYGYYPGGGDKPAGYPHQTPSPLQSGQTPPPQQHMYANVQTGPAELGSRMEPVEMPADVPPVEAAGREVGATK